MSESTSPSQRTLPGTGASRPRVLTWASVALVALALIGVIVLALARRGREASESRRLSAAVARGFTVQVAQAELLPAEQVLSLPGEVRGWAQTTLYAKVAGYVREIPVDKGTRVNKGDLIARLESPETDQAVLAARADLELKRQQLQRTSALRPEGVVSQQELDNATAALRVAEATLQQALAQQSYELIRAPFSGVITARYVDVGALVPAGTGSTQTVQPVVDLSDLDRLRIQVYLGQADAARLRPGDPVSLVTDTDPGHPLEVVVSRLSMGLDARNRTMLCEMDVDNRPVRLFPGQFVRATLRLRGARLPQVPSDSLAWRGDKLFVAVLEEGRARLRPIQAGDDDGTRVTILSGLQGGETVVLNPSAELQDGDAVQVVQKPVPPAPPVKVSSPSSGPAPGAGVPAPR
jgi:membrane fusion protein, multidrug efflux system